MTAPLTNCEPGEREQEKWPLFAHRPKAQHTHTRRPLNGRPAQKVTDNGPYLISFSASPVTWPPYPLPRDWWHSISAPCLWKKLREGKEIVPLQQRVREGKEIRKGKKKIRFGLLFHQDKLLLHQWPVNNWWAIPYSPPQLPSLRGVVPRFDEV